jgi:hypothetical protein
MPARGSEASAVADANLQSQPEGDFQSFILARVAAEGGATRTIVSRDLNPYLTHKFSPAEWRKLVDATLADLEKAGAVTQSRGRYMVTEAGRTQSTDFLASKAGSEPTWQMQRDVALVAKALGIEKEGAVKLKALARPEGLRAMIVQKAFGLPIRKNVSPAKLRAQLALVALERAFGNKIKSSIGPKSALPAQASRALAGQLAEKPRTFSTDAQLITQLAAEAVGARQTSIDELRLMILRVLAISLLEPKPASAKKAKTTAKPERSKKPAQQPKKKPAATLTPANDTAPSPVKRQVIERPDVNHFSNVINATAGDVAEGWPGNFKAFISRVWEAIRKSHPQWNLSEIEFKCMLVEAHRLGHVVLAGADLKNKKDMDAFNRSAITYKNTVWYFIRVENQ